MSDDNLDVIGAGIAEMRTMLDEHKAIVKRDWALQESYILHGKGHSVPIGILDTDRLWLKRESDRRVISRWLAMIVLGLASLVTLLALASAGLDGPLEYGAFALFWYISIDTAIRADKDGKTVWRIVQHKTGRRL